MKTNSKKIEYKEELDTIAPIRFWFHHLGEIEIEINKSCIIEEKERTNNKTFIVKVARLSEVD